MSLDEVLSEELTRALKAREREVVDALRMVKSRIAERRVAPGTGGKLTPEQELEVVTAYVKSLKNAAEEIEKGGGGDNPILAKYRFEIAFLDKYLPKKLGEPETLEIVRAIIREAGVTGPSAVGRVMGAIMKAHKNEVDATLARRLAEQELGVPPSA